MWCDMQYRAQPLLALVAIFALLLETSFPARAQTPPPAEARFAFVIGNDSYDNAALPTAAFDAGLVAETLRNAGFDITGARNLDQDTLRASYREFIDKVAAAGPDAVGAVYLSGYGLQVEGENYLVPVGARVQRDTDVSLNAIRISDLTRALGALPSRATMVMLDLAYPGPFGKQGQPLAPGLSIVEPEANMAVGFNTSPGTTARIPTGNYGPYAQAISEIFRIPGLPLNDLLARVRTRTAELTKGEQVPWSASKADPAFQLLERAPDAPAATVTARQIEDARARPIRDFSDADAYSAALDRDTIQGYADFLTAYPQSRYAKNVRGILAARREAVTWRRTILVNTPNAYWSYLNRYAHGPHAPDARRRLARLSAALQPPPNFDAIEYDVAPPPADEDVYFAGPTPDYYDDDAPPPPIVGFMPPPPPWWEPPPPPREYIDEDVYFLPTPVAPPPPEWIRPPHYVVVPPPLYVPPQAQGRPGISPYVAIPAALAAGIVAGRIISGRRGPGGAPAGASPGAGPGGAVGPGGAQRPAFMPPVTTPARPITQIITQQGQTGQRPNGQVPPVGPQGGQVRPGLPGGPSAGAPAGQPGGAGFGGQQGLPGGPGRPQPGVQPGAALPGVNVQPGGNALPRPGQNALPGQPVQGGPQGQGLRPTGGPGGGAPQGRPGGVAPVTPQPDPRQQQLLQQQQQRLQQQQLQQQRTQQQQQQQLQQQRAQQQQQQQLQQQRAQQQRQQQLQQQRAQQQQQQQLQQQRAQQQQQQQLQQQRAQQQQQQQLQQQRAQQQQQQQLQQQRAQQQQQQQRAQQQQQQKQAPRCGHPGEPACPR